MFEYDPSGRGPPRDVTFGVVLPIPLAVLSTGYRLWTQLYLHRNRVAVDDFLMIWATVVFVTGCSLGLYGLVGDRSQEERMPDVRLVYYVFVHFYIVSTAGTKFPVLALYHRVFPSTPFRYLILASAFLVFTWQVGTQAALGIYCRPIRKFWIPKTEGSCLGTYGACLYHSITNLLLDTWIFFMPISLILRMRITMRKKVLLACLFLMGLATCAICAYRLALYMQLSSSHGTNNAVVLLLLWEPFGAILCANLPLTYKPLVSLFWRITGRPEESGSPRGSPHSWYQRHVAARQRKREREKRGVWGVESSMGLERQGVFFGEGARVETGIVVEKSVRGDMEASSGDGAWDWERGVGRAL